MLLSRQRRSGLVVMLRLNDIKSDYAPREGYHCVNARAQTPRLGSYTVSQF
jgi:hypothetical protein